LALAFRLDTWWRKREGVRALGVKEGFARCFAQRVVGNGSRALRLSFEAVFALAAWLQWLSFGPRLPLGCMVAKGKVCGFRRDGRVCTLLCAAGRFFLRE